MRDLALPPPCAQTSFWTSAGCVLSLCKTELGVRCLSSAVPKEWSSLVFLLSLGTWCWCQRCSLVFFFILSLVNWYKVLCGYSYLECSRDGRISELWSQNYLKSVIHWFCCYLVGGWVYCFGLLSFGLVWFDLATRVILNPALISLLLKWQSRSYSLGGWEDSTQQPTQVKVKECRRHSGNSVNLFSRSDPLFVTFVAWI